METRKTHNICMQVSKLIDTELSEVKTFAELDMKHKALDQRISEGISRMKQIPEIWTDAEIDEVAQYANDTLELRVLVRHTSIRTEARLNWEF